MSNVALFIIGLAITLPAGGVVLALVFAAGIDQRADKKREAAASARSDASGAIAR